MEHVRRGAAGRPRGDTRAAVPLGVQPTPSGPRLSRCSHTACSAAFAVTAARSFPAPRSTTRYTASTTRQPAIALPPPGRSARCSRGAPTSRQPPSAVAHRRLSLAWTTRHPAGVPRPAASRFGSGRRLCPASLRASSRAPARSAASLVSNLEGAAEGAAENATPREGRSPLMPWCYIYT